MRVAEFAIASERTELPVFRREQMSDSVIR